MRLGDVVVMEVYEVVGRCDVCTALDQAPRVPIAPASFVSSFNEPDAKPGPLYAKPTINTAKPEPI